MTDGYEALAGQAHTVGASPPPTGNSALDVLRLLGWISPIVRWRWFLVGVVVGGVAVGYIFRRLTSSYSDEKRRRA